MLARAQPVAVHPPCIRTHSQRCCSLHTCITRSRVCTRTRRESRTHTRMCAQVRMWRHRYSGGRPALMHTQQVHICGGHRRLPPAGPPCLQVTVTRQPLPGGHVPLANGKCTNGVLSNSLPQHPCTSDMVSLFQGYIKNCHLMLKCPRRSRCCEGCPPFYCYRN